MKLRRLRAGLVNTPESSDQTFTQSSNQSVNRGIFGAPLRILCAAVFCVVLGACSHITRSTHQDRDSTPRAPGVGESAGHAQQGEGVVVGPGWGTLPAVVTYGALTMTRQPSKKDFEGVKARGFKVVINLAQADELSFDEKALVESLGMTYVPLPIQAKRSLDRKVLDRVTEAVEEYHDAKILIHGSSASRVGAWFAYHMNQNYKWDKAKALKQGELVGMKPELRRYVEPLLK